MAAAPQTGMEKPDMHKLLTQSKEKPVHCAIGVGKDQSFGLLLMDKMKAPKALEKNLIDSIPDAKNTQFGTAQVDFKDDPKLVKFYLNKPISSMARRLVKTLKGTGFTKVQIMLEDGTPVETAAEEEDPAAEAAPTNGAAPPAEAPAAAAAASPPPPPPPPEAAAAPAQDAAALARRLAELAPRIPQAAGGDDGRKAELLKMASMANVNIKTNNLTYAATYVEQLSRALDAAPPPPPPAPPPPEAPAAPAQDAAALAKRLAELAPRIPQVAGDDANRRAELLKLATQVNVNIKTNNLTYAATYLEQLRRAIEGGAAQPAAAAPAAAADPTASRNLLAQLTLQIPKVAGSDGALHERLLALSDRASTAFAAGRADEGAAGVEQLRAAMAAAQAAAAAAGKNGAGPVAYAKSRLAWLAARKKMQGDIDTLRGKIVDAYPDFAADLDQRYQARVSAVLDGLDESLADALDAASSASDPEKRQKLVANSQSIIKKYQAFIAGEKTIDDLDANPFVPLSIRATMTATLATLDKTLR